MVKIGFTSQWTSIGKSFSSANSWSAVLLESCPVSLESMSSLISGTSFSTLMSCSTKGSTLILSQHIKVSRDLSSEELWEEEWLSSRLMTTEQGELWWHDFSPICFPAHAAFCTWVPFSTLSLCSAASALDMFSCFFHLVRRFWNHIFTWKTNNNNNMYKQKSAHPLITWSLSRLLPPERVHSTTIYYSVKNMLSVVSGTLIAKAECDIGKKWTVNWYHVWGGNRYAQYASA